MKNKQLSNPVDYQIRLARAADSEEIARVHWTAYKTTYKNIFDQNYLNDLCLADYVTLREKIVAANSGIHLVATYQEKIIGFYDADWLDLLAEAPTHQAKSEDFLGKIYALYLLAPYQRMGIGKALFFQGKAKLQALGLNTFDVWVMQANDSAIKFYEQMGGRFINKFITTIGAKQYDEFILRFYN